MRYSQSRLGWHFIKKSRRLTHGDGRYVEAGETMRVMLGTSVRLCHGGMHASGAIMDACEYWEQQGMLLCRVRVNGIAPENISEDKFCGTSRQVLWIIDPEQEFVQVALEVLRQAIMDDSCYDVASGTIQSCERVLTRYRDGLVTREHCHRVFQNSMWDWTPFTPRGLANIAYVCYQTSWAQRRLATLVNRASRDPRRRLP